MVSKQEMTFESIDQEEDFVHFEDFEGSEASLLEVLAEENLLDFESDADLNDDQVQIEQIDVVNDPVGLYFRQMAQVPLLTSEQELELAKRLRAARVGEIKKYFDLLRAHPHFKAEDFLFPASIEAQRDQLLALPEFSELDEETLDLILDGFEAFQYLVKANTRFVVSIAKKYLGKGQPFADLIQNGNVGLLRAAIKYDPDKGNRFSTYAIWWIWQSITRNLAVKTRTIKLPLYQMENLRLFGLTSRQLEQKLGRKPSFEEISARIFKETGKYFPPEEIEELFQDARQPFELNRPVGKNGNSEFGEFLEDRESPEPQESVEDHLLKELVAELFLELTPIEANVLRLRFGFNSEERRFSLIEVANRFGLSPEWVRQLEKKAIQHMMRNPRSKGLKEYY
jgi:RNA polymerase primary sigma factor